MGRLGMAFRTALGAALGASLMIGLLTGCDALSGKDHNEDDAAEDEGKKKRKKKKDKEKEEAEEAELDINAEFGESASFGGAFDMFGDVMFGATSHDPYEPDNFSAGWVGRESMEVLKAARDGKYRHSQVRMASRRICLVFKDGNTVRRAMIASRRNAPTEELAFAANGNLIFWYRHNRKKKPDTFEDWAYFHRGNSLMLYQTRASGGHRHAENVRPELRAHILRGARECIQASRAANPLPGAARPTPAAPAPAPTPTPGGSNGSASSAALHFGALAFSESGSAWRISYRKGSEQQAKTEALGGCKQADCKVRATFTKGQCMSIIHGPSRLVTWGWANDNNAAQKNAIEQCTNRGNPEASCALQGTWCNDG